MFAVMPRVKARGGMLGRDSMHPEPQPLFAVSVSRVFGWVGTYGVIGSTVVCPMSPPPAPVAFVLVHPLVPCVVSLVPCVVPRVPCVLLFVILCVPFVVPFVVPPVVPGMSRGGIAW